MHSGQEVVIDNPESWEWYGKKISEEASFKNQ